MSMLPAADASPCGWRAADTPILHLIPISSRGRSLALLGTKVRVGTICVRPIAVCSIAITPPVSGFFCPRAMVIVGVRELMAVVRAVTVAAVRTCVAASCVMFAAAVRPVYATLLLATHVP